MGLTTDGEFTIWEVCVFEIKDTSHICVRNLDSNFEWVQAQVHSRGINSTVSLFGRDVCLIIIFYIIRHYEFRPFVSNSVDLMPLLQTALEQSRPLVVYVDSKKNTIDLAIFAKDNFPGDFKDGKFGAMHALLSSQERTLLNSDFAAGIILVMFCTSILEMGIDKHNLDAIVNIGPLHSGPCLPPPERKRLIGSRYIEDG